MSFDLKENGNPEFGFPFSSFLLELDGKTFELAVIVRHSQNLRFLALCTNFCPNFCAK